MIHFHLLGTLASGADIRTGLDFVQVNRRDYRTVSAELRGVWAVMRQKLPLYGFGRHELLPVRKTGDAVAAYVSKYIEKNVCQRSPADKGKRLVRYIGWQKRQLKPNEFEWDGVRARAWRAKTGQLFEMAGCQLKEFQVNPPKRIIQDCASGAGKIRPKCLDGSEIKMKFGPRWAMVGTEIWSEVFTDDKLPFLDVTPNRLLKCQELLGRAQKKFEAKILSNFRWLKEGCFDDMVRWEDEEDAQREFWKLEHYDEMLEGGMILPDDYFSPAEKIENLPPAVDYSDIRAAIDAENRERQEKIARNWEKWACHGESNLN
jgi:hypothetical protein